jgi:hypothetical protein
MAAVLASSSERKAGHGDRSIRRKKGGGEVVMVRRRVVKRARVWQITLATAGSFH